MCPFVFKDPLLRAGIFFHLMQNLLIRWCMCFIFLQGHIGLVDYDDVEINNLHRQILHSENDVGLPKTESAFNKLLQLVLIMMTFLPVDSFLIRNTFSRLNQNVKISKHNCQLTTVNSLSIIRQYDVVLDATDNVATRYLLNDSCVFLSKPLVSGSALLTEGQLTVYNHLSSPCYRCLFPQPPPANTVNNCSSSGVLGPGTRALSIISQLCDCDFVKIEFLHIKCLKMNTTSDLRRIFINKFRSQVFNFSGW